MTIKRTSKARTFLSEKTTLTIKTYGQSPFKKRFGMPRKLLHRTIVTLDGVGVHVCRKGAVMEENDYHLQIIVD